MRKSRLLDSIIPPGRQRILAATLLPPEREWYVGALASHLDVTPSTLQLDLGRLAESGVLLRRRDGNRVYYRADPACPILPELRTLLAKTAGLADVLRDALAPFSSTIRCAFVHGSVARAAEGSESDVDLIVIGGVELADIALPLRAARERLGREVNTSVYSVEELAGKAGGGHHFVTKVLAREKIFVVGSQDELDDVVGRKAGGGGDTGEAGD